MLLWRPDHTGSVEDAWSGIQRPEPDRIQLVDAPGWDSDVQRPIGRVLRTELRPGDLTTTGTYVAPRAEVMDRYPYQWKGAPDEWPDPVGSERWYGFSIMAPLGFQAAADYRPWLVLTQWKGHKSGSPAIALEIQRDRWRLGGAHRDLGPIVRGRWTKFIVGMHLSPVPEVGWVQVYRDGRLVVPRTHRPTMNTYNGTVDPIYLKQGIYRSKLWETTHVFHYGPVRVGTTADDVA